ncbi:MAG: hypothetical protein PHV49_06225 [Alistipes sp.]|nr:hypothetical protein [Alistipes sp.]
MKYNYLIGAISLLLFSCVQIPDAQKSDPDPDPDTTQKVLYIYPFGTEPQTVTAQVVIHTDGTVDLSKVTAEIPPLKYNKSLLLLLTQDDCKQAAYCTTWAAIHGKPLSLKYYYDASHLQAGDLPPDAYSLGKTLGSTDGAGNEVRFSFATTLSAELSYMDATPVVQQGWTKDYYRFFMKAGLIWEDVAEMVNYGVGISFHDLRTRTVNNADTLQNHLVIAQRLIQQKLNGRGCIMMAEPNGNRTYITAAQAYSPIKIMTAQSGALELRPYEVSNDLDKQVLLRTFHDSPLTVLAAIQQQMQRPAAQRTAISLGIHGTDSSWANFLLWLNDTYGKDGSDEVWMPSMEEYYHYNYLRFHATIDTHIEQSDLHLTITLPSNLYAYYPALTLDLKGMPFKAVTAVGSGSTVTGLSFSSYGADTLMVNMDCRQALLAHATHYVEQYQKSPSASNKADARYFVGQLKESEHKTRLLNTIR